MENTIQPLINADALSQILLQQSVVIVDATNAADAYLRYTQRHIHGALFVDVNTQLTDIKTDLSHGGRHPLPTVSSFAKTLGSLGITSHSHVVVYDDKYGANAAARFWWMLQSIGHKKVQVLNGGIQAAEKAGLPMDGEEVTPLEAQDYPASQWQWPTADIDEVEAVALRGDHLVIDVRENKRYKGETEPIDLIAGHIPGAVNMPFTENLESDGTFLPAENLMKKYELLLHGITAENVIVHCGSGVTACHTLLAMSYAGLEIPKLYVGSWSEWSRNNKPLVTKD